MNKQEIGETLICGWIKIRNLNALLSNLISYNPLLWLWHQLINSFSSFFSKYFLLIRLRDQSQLFVFQIVSLSFSCIAFFWSHPKISLIFNILSSLRQQLIKVCTFEIPTVSFKTSNILQNSLIWWKNFQQFSTDVATRCCKVKHTLCAEFQWAIVFFGSKTFTFYYH